MPAKKISKAEAFYIESHFGKQTAAEIAADIGISVKAVTTYVAKLEESGVVPPPTPPEKSIPEKAGFGVHENETGPQSVVMTKTASERGDKLNETGRNNDFFEKRVHKGIHVIDPSKPVR